MVSSRVVLYVEAPITDQHPQVSAATCKPVFVPRPVGKYTEGEGSMVGFGSQGRWDYALDTRRRSKEVMIIQPDVAQATAVTRGKSGRFRVYGESETDLGSHMIQISCVQYIAKVQLHGLAGSERL
jgi:hypothetical protein